MARKRTRSEVDEEEYRRDTTEDKNMNEEELEAETSTRINTNEEIRGPGGEGIVKNLAVLLVIYCSGSFIIIMQSYLIYIAVVHLEYCIMILQFSIFTQLIWII